MGFRGQKKMLKDWNWGKNVNVKIYRKQKSNLVWLECRV